MWLMTERQARCLIFNIMAYVSSNLNKTLLHSTSIYQLSSIKPKLYYAFGIQAVNVTDSHHSLKELIT